MTENRKLYLSIHYVTLFLGVTPVYRESWYEVTKMYGDTSSIDVL